MIASASSDALVGEIGEVMHLAKSGRIIVKVSSGASPKPGELVVDNGGKKIGRITELMGPIVAPYASVIPMTDRVNRLIGTKLFSGGFAEKRRTNRPSSRRSR